MEIKENRIIVHEGRLRIKKKVGISVTAFACFLPPTGWCTLLGADEKKDLQNMEGTCREHRGR
jgi:hypothetical protein